MGNTKDVEEAKRILVFEARRLIWEAWELIPDGEARKELTAAIQAIERSIHKLNK